MYSVVLMIGMTAGAPEVPQGLIFNRGARASCSGSMSQATLIERRTPIRNFFAATTQAAATLVSRPRAVLVEKTVVKEKTVTRASGCTGGAAVSGMVVNAIPTDQTVEASGLIKRVAVHRQLHKALRSGKIAPEDVPIVKRALEDPGVYEMAVTRTASMLNKDIKASGKTVSAQAFGDGHLLQLLIDNLPKIIAAIKEIISLFGYITPEQMRGVFDYYLGETYGECLWIMIA